MRGQGVGRALLNWATEKCREKQCGLVQLTTDETRSDAHEFFFELGLAASPRGSS